MAAVQGIQRRGIYKIYFTHKAPTTRIAMWLIVLGRNAGYMLKIWYPTKKKNNKTNIQLAKEMLSRIF